MTSHNTRLKAIARQHACLNGATEDEAISVSLTASEIAYCIEIKVDDITLYMHTRSAVDLHRKLGNALCDWIGASAICLQIEQKG